ncbi:glycosyltransferase [Lacrimispora saccharolytica]|nr:glycosyltransferase [Lacrimispora saccharolytica]
MVHIKYSVIIPVYNAQKTLKRCLDSLLQQKREDVEIILINDGSSDRSEEIIQNYKKRFQNIKAVKQENAGVSAARNRGLDIARGTYITFVDSDDYVSQDYFMVMDEAGEREDSDLIVFAKDIVGKGIDESALYGKMCAEKTLEEKRKILLNSRIIFQPPYKRFKRRIIEKTHLRFIKGMYVGEDFNFCFSYMLKCNTINIKYKKIYYIDISEKDSLSRKYRADIDRQLYWEINEAVKAVKKSRLDFREQEELLMILDYFMARNIFTCISETFKIGKPSYKKNRKKYMDICSRFNVRVCRTDGYCSKMHFLIRILLYRKMIFLLYFVTKSVKGKEFRKYLKKE